jgi:hypothetical protein
LWIVKEIKAIQYLALLIVYFVFYNKFFSMMTKCPGRNLRSGRGVYPDL